jgi:hypothetical protein
VNREQQKGGERGKSDGEGLLHLPRASSRAGPEPSRGPGNTAGGSG